MHSWLQGDYSWFTLKIYKNWLSSLWTTAKRNHSNYERSLRSMMSHSEQRMKIRFFWLNRKKSAVEKQNIISHNWNLVRSCGSEPFCSKHLLVLSGQPWVNILWEQGHCRYSTGIPVRCLQLLTVIALYLWGFTAVVPPFVGNAYMGFGIYKVHF